MPLDAIPPALAGLGAELIEAGRLRLRYRPSQQPFSQLLAQVQGAGLDITDLSTREADLEDLFLELTRRPAD